VGPSGRESESVESGVLHSGERRFEDTAMSYTVRECDCGSGKTSDQQHDGYGIPLCRTCPDCHDTKMSKFRSDIFDRYDCDERIEDDY